MTDNIEESGEISGNKWTDLFKPKNGGSEGDDSEKEIAELKDKLLRTLAELENTRRRATEEKDKALKFAITNFTKDLIAVMENFYLAFNSVVGKDFSDSDFSIFFSGMELTFSEFKKIFEKNGIKRIYPIGEQFNPDFHEAIVQVDDEEKESGMIVDVMQAGYLLNGRVLKPALVAVVK
ncbi:MAG: nucleotide exchange factor GrpE [Rickettsiales bacterium]|jgi:molecular chaperone GrpE|nr:nucleotide exchange factor GrpE [Rickettsiales bacterium]